MIVNSNPAKFLAGWATRRAIAAYREIQEKTMTKTTEELKREMYARLADLKQFVRASQFNMKEFEEAFEIYLEALRQEMAERAQKIEILRDLCDKAQTGRESIAAERDTLRNKLQAFEFANRSAAELLSEALREPSGLRKSSQATPQQESEDRGSCAACRPSVALNYPSNVVPIFKLIRENTEYTLTSEQFEAFELMLQSKPASENKALQDLLSRKPSWDNGDQS